MAIDTSNVDPNAATIFENQELRIAALETSEITIQIPQVIAVTYEFNDGTIRKFVPEISSGSNV